MPGKTQGERLDSLQDRVHDLDKLIVALTARIDNLDGAAFPDAIKETASTIETARRDLEKELASLRQEAALHQREIDKLKKDWEIFCDRVWKFIVGVGAVIVTIILAMLGLKK
jgi:ABC-type transporter Mla subunit MlaD